MVAPQADNEQVRYDIVIEAKAALASLQELLRATEDNAQKVKIFANVVLEQSKAMGVSWQQLLSVYKELNAELSKSHQSNVFGNTGGQNLMQGSEQYLQTLEETGRLSDEVAQKSEVMGTAVENGSRRAVRGIDAIRIAMGAIVAMIVFQVIQAFQQLFSMAITGLREMETGMYNLVNAEKALSEQGIDISPKDLQDIIDKLQKLDPLLSKIQATELVSSAATKVASAVGFTREQIQQFTQDVAVLAIRNKGLGKSFEEVQSQIENAFLTGKVSQGINNLGVKITDQIVRDEALRLGLVKTADAFDKLTGKAEAHVKAVAMLSLINQNANKDLSHLPDYFKTADASFGIFQARLQDFLQAIGTKFGPVLQQIFTSLADILTKMLNYINQNDKAMNTFVAGISVLAKVSLGLVSIFIQWNMWLGQVGAKISAILGKIPFVNKLVQNLFPSQSLPDTPTNTNVPNADEQQANDNKAKAVAEAESKIQDIMQESADKKAQIELDYGRKLEDISRGYSQKLEDIARDTAQKREDALRTYNQKVDDINRNAAEEEARAKEDARQKEIDREKEYQQKLKELREKFLMDLEDALRNRDARQVLRLIRQYNLDKQNLADRQKLDQQQAKRDLAFKLQQIEQDRQLKLAAAKREYDDKLQEIAIGEQRAIEEANLWRQRQTQDANTWYQRQLADYRTYLQQKLRDLAQALMKEYQLTAAGASAIFKLLSTYFGAGGSISQMLGTSLTSSMNGILSPSSGGGTAGAFPVFSPNANSGGGFPVFSPNGYAEGGTLIATRPTQAIFGEKGPEKVDITPIGRRGNNVGKVFGDKSGIGTGGNVHLRLELSPDLEAKIIDSSLENLSVHIDRIGRSK